MLRKIKVYRVNGVEVSRNHIVDATKKACPHRGEQLRTITSAICSKKTIDLPVYACGLYGGECVHRQVCSDHDPAIRICVGCPREIE
jgi:hypothetical protein